MRNLLIAFASFLSAVPAWATLPNSAITSQVATIYGIYTTSDATCLTGWTASIPLSATATSVDFATNPTLGTGPVASPINCLLFVVKNSFSWTVAAGTYTGTSNSHPDSNCNSGASQTTSTLQSSSAPVWPSQVTTDAQAAGLTLTTSALTGVSTEVAPVYLSVNSKCALAPTDPSGCVLSSLNPFAPPGSGSTAGSSLNGLQLTSVTSTSGTVYLAIVDYFGGVDNLGHCGQTAPGQFIVHQ